MWLATAFVIGSGRQSLGLEQDIVAPPFLECDARAGFNAVWEVFRAQVAANAQQGWPLDHGLALMAAQLLDVYDDASTGRSWAHPAGAVWESFRTGGADWPMLPPAVQVVPAGGGQEGSLIIESSRAAARGHVCLYGLATALFVAYRHEVARGVADAHRHLEVILWLLGETAGGEQLFDFLESSQWPVRSIDVEVNLDLASSEAARFVLHSRLRLQRVPYSAAGKTKIGPSFVAPRLVSSLHSSPLGLRLAVVGIHGATSLEPASALAAAWPGASPSGGAPMEQRFFGHPCPRYELTTYLCDWKNAMLPGTGGEDAVAEVLAEMVNMTAQHVERAWEPHAALARLAAAYAAEGFLRHAELWLCSGPAVLCALLHATAPEKPMIFWHCRHLLDGLGALANATRTLVLMSLRTMAAAPGVAFLACEDFAAAQAAAQLGVAAPAVQRRLGLYTEAYPWRGFDAGGKGEDVVVLRSMLWSRLPGLYFRAVLEAFVEENRARFNFRFTFGSDTTDRLVPYQELGLHRCAVLVPNDLTMAAFVEAFAMGIPLFMPTDEWLYRLQKSVPYGFMVSEGGQRRWRRTAAGAFLEGEASGRWACPPLACALGLRYVATHAALRVHPAAPQRRRRARGRAPHPEPRHAPVGDSGQGGAFAPLAKYPYTPHRHDAADHHHRLGLLGLGSRQRERHRHRQRRSAAAAHAAHATSLRRLGLRAPELRCRWLAGLPPPGRAQRRARLPGLARDGRGQRHDAAARLTGGGLGGGRGGAGRRAPDFSSSCLQ